MISALFIVQSCPKVVVHFWMTFCKNYSRISCQIIFVNKHWLQSCLCPFKYFIYFYISENENPELYKNGGRSAMLQIFPRGRSAMKGGRSKDLHCCKPSPLGEGLQCCKSSGGRSAMLQIFRGKVCKGEDLQYNTGQTHK